MHDIKTPSDVLFILLGAILERFGPLQTQFDAMRTQMPVANTHSGLLIAST